MILTLAALWPLWPARAAAMGAVVGPASELVALSTERIAIATSGGGATTRWAQVQVSGATAGYAWLVPVMPGARLDLGSDAWLDALDAATSPVVLPPAALPLPTDGCVVGSDPDLVAPTVSPTSISPTSAEVLTDLPSLTSLLADAGYPIQPDLAPRLAAVFSAGGAIAALLFPSAALPTHTLRIMDASPPALPFALSGSTYGDLTVTAFVVAAGPEGAGTTPLTVDPSSVLWVADAQSTYAQARTTLLQQSQGTEWLTESAMPGLFFTGARIVGSTSLPTVLSQYFTLAARYGDATGNADECIAAAGSTRNDDGSYASTCPGGVLATAPGPSPCAPGSAGIDVSSLACGGDSSDAALAVATLSPGQIWVSRLEGLVTLESAADVPVVASPPPAPDSTGSQSPVLTASGYDCASAPSTPSTGGAGAAGGGASSAGDPSGSNGSAAADVASNGCGAVLAGLDSCGGDSSDSSSDDSCGSDSSGDSSSGGCSSSEGGDSGGGCSGDAGGDGSCRTARPVHHGRSPVSRILLVCAAAAAIARRYSGREKRTRRHEDAKIRERDG